jgi:hypothetical protein
MTGEISPYVVQRFLNSLIFGIPAVLALYWWQRRGIQSKLLYSLSRANAIAYGVWLLFVWVTTLVGQSPAYRSMIPVILTASLFVILPSLLAGGSFFLLCLTMSAEKLEKPLLAVNCGLMLILWGSSVVAPN